MEFDRLVDLFVGCYASDRTQRSYRQALQAWAAWCSRRDLDPLAAERHHAESWRQALERAGRSSETIRHHMSAVSSAYNYGLDEQLPGVQRNPFARARRPPKVSESSTAGLSAEQFGRLVDVARTQGTLELVAVLMLGALGLRAAEVCAARVEHLGEDAEVPILHLPHRKGGRRGIAVLPPLVLAAVREHVGGRRHGPLLLQAWQADVPVTEQTHLPYRTLYAMVGRLGRLAKVPNLHPHALRHTFATLALDAGVQLLDVQYAMGHQSADSTVRYDRSRGRLHRAPSLAVASTLEATPTQRRSRGRATPAGTMTGT